MKGWSVYGAERAQPVATGGKWDDPENRSNKPIRNQWQPTATVSQRMVRRGSTVRVRQRALQDPRSRGFSVQNDLLFVARAVGMELFMELSRSRGSKFVVCEDNLAVERAVLRLPGIAAWLRVDLVCVKEEVARVGRVRPLCEPSRSG
jgi:hypothetical protein